MDFNRSRTLVVDDHPGMLASLARALEACAIRALLQAAWEGVRPH